VNKKQKKTNSKKQYKTNYQKNNYSKRFFLNTNDYICSVRKEILPNFTPSIEIFMNYIKVTVKGKKPVIVLEANKHFYQKQEAKIETPTQAEIEAAFPEETKKSPVQQEDVQNLANEKLASATAELEKANEALKAEKSAHEETKAALATATAELEKAKEALTATQKEIEKLSKK
jgi:hypothetical protein